MPQALDKNTRKGIYELAKALYPEHAEEGGSVQEAAAGMQNVGRGASIVRSAFQNAANSLYPDEPSSNNDASNHPNGTVHVMRRGDTLWGLSHLYDVPLEEIQAVNPHITDPTRVPVGAKINIPESGADQESAGKDAQSPSVEAASTPPKQVSIQGSPMGVATGAPVKMNSVRDAVINDLEESMFHYSAPGIVWGENGIHNIPDAKLDYPLTDLATRPYAVGERFAHGVVAAGNGYPFNRALVAQAQKGEKAVNLKQLCKEAGLDCGLIKIINGIPYDQELIPNGTHLSLPNYSDGSKFAPGDKLLKRQGLTQAYLDYLDAMEVVRKNPQMMQYMEKDNTGDPFRAIAYVRGTPIPSNDWSVLNWFRVAGKNSINNEAVGYWFGGERQNGRDVVISQVGNRKIVDNNLCAAERFATTRLGVWDFFPGAQPFYLAGHAVLKGSKLYPGGSTDVKFVEGWGSEGDRLRQLEKGRKKAGQ